MRSLSEGVGLLNMFDRGLTELGGQVVLKISWLINLSLIGY